MSNYTKSTNFATKDNLSPGDPLKIVRGTEIDTEFNNISTAISTKTDNSAAAITGGSITGITDLAIADGGTGASTATAAINNLLPAQTSAANKYLQSDGTNVSWDAVTLSTADITGTLPVANGGTGVTSSTGTGNVVLSNSPTLVTPALGTPASGVATNLTGLPISTGVSGLGTGIATFLGTPSSANLISAVTDETGTGSLVFATSPTLVTPALGTPSALVGTNITGTASGLTAGNVTTNANLTGAVTSVGNATSLGSFSSANLLGALTDETGTGSAVFATSPTLVTPILGTPTSATLTNATGLPIATGVSGLGTGVATFLATPSSDNLRSALTDETGTGSAVFATSPTLVTPILGTPQSGNFSTGTFTWPTFNQNTTGTAAGLSATLATTSGGTNLTSFTSGGVVYASSSSALATGSALTFNGSQLNVSYADTAYNAGLIVTNTTNNSASQAKIYAVNNAGDYISLGRNSTLLGGQSAIFATGNYPLEFFTDSTLRMTLTGTSLYTASGINVGIGLSNPNGLFNVKGSNGQVLLTNGNTSGGMKITATNSTFTADGYLAFEGYTKEYGRFDSAGNLGLGVTPSAWDSSVKALQVGSGAALHDAGSGNTILSSNLYYSSTGNRYIATDFATAYQQNNGTHYWYNAPSGTAGNAISFTQAMTLDANGALLIGVTTASTNVFQEIKYTTAIIGTRYINTSSSSSIVMDFVASSAQVGSITTSGSATLYNVTSDQRLKENIEDADSASSFIDSLKVRKFDWKSDNTHQRYGFVAQELVTVAPEAVYQPDDADEMMAVDYSKLVPMLVKEIQSLRQRVAQLETN